MSSVIHALCRVYKLTAGAGLPKGQWMSVVPKEKSAKRRPDWEKHIAEDVLRILNAGDSQPGAMLHPLTTDAKSSLFAYGAHLENGSSS